MNQNKVTLESLDAKIDILVNGLEGRFESIDQRFDKVDERFDKVDERLDRIDERLDKADERMDKMDERFGKMDERMDNMDSRFDTMDLEFYAVHQEINQTYLLARDTAKRVEHIETKMNWMQNEHNQIRKIPELSARLEYTEDVVQQHSKELDSLRTAIIK